MPYLVGLVGVFVVWALAGAAFWSLLVKLGLRFEVAGRSRRTAAPLRPLHHRRAIGRPIAHVALHGTRRMASVRAGMTRSRRAEASSSTRR